MNPTKILEECTKLLGVRKAAIRTSNGKETGVRMNFKFLPAGALIHYYSLDSHNNHVFISEEKLDHVEPTETRYVVGLVITDNKIATYINMKGFISKDTYFAIRKHPKGFLLSRATHDEVEAFASSNGKRSKKSGRVSKIHTMSLVKTDRERLTRQGQETNYIVALHFGERLYAQLYCIKDSSDYPTLSEIQRSSGGFYSIENMEKIEYKVNLTGNALRLPAAFIKAGRIKPGDQLETWIAPDNKMIIEVNPIICDICNKPIRRYEEGPVTIHLCEGCANTLPAVKTYVQQSNSTTSHEKLVDAHNYAKADLMALKNELIKLNNIITA